MPDTFARTDHAITQSSLANGAGHTFAPAAETCARITVESNIRTRCAVPLSPASMAKKSSNTRALPRRSNRFQTLFQFPNRSGRARQVMLWTVK